MKRKILALLLGITMAVTAAGCGGTKDTAAGTEEPAAASSNEEGDSKEADQTDAKAGEVKPETVLTFMAVGGSNEQAFTDVITAAADLFNAGNDFNAKIELEWYENEQYKTKLATLMTQNDVTDIFFTWEAGFMEDYVNSGKVYSLSEGLNADSEWMGRFNSGVFDAVTYNDQIYAVPMGQAIIPVYYNTQMFKENNVEVPTTWDEFMNAVKTFKDAGVIPVSMACQDAWVPAQMLLELSGGVAGKELFDDIVSGKTTWDDPRYVETGKLLQEMAAAGAFPESFLGLAYDEGRSLFTSQKAAMYPMGTWDTSAVIEGMGGTDNVGVFLLPAKNPEYNDVHIASVEKLFAISEKCENKEAAMAFLKLLSDPQIQEKYVVDCGALSATNLQIDESKVDPVTAQIMKLQGQVKKALTPMDRQFGANVGGEFNNISLAIAGGKDAQEQFTALQKYAEQEAEQ